MSKETARTRETWTRPQLVRLGTIKDVAGPTGLGVQSPTQLRT